MPTIWFEGICGFTRNSGTGAVKAVLPRAPATMPFPGQLPHVAFLKVNRAMIGAGSTIQDSNLGNTAFLVARLTGDDVTIGGTLSSGPANVTGMVHSSVADLAVLTNQAQPTAGKPVDATVVIPSGILTPKVIEPLLKWGFGVSGSTPPSVGVPLANLYRLALALSGGTSLYIQTSAQGRLNFLNAANAEATIGSLEETEIHKTGPHEASLEDHDFIFHYGLTAGGINVNTNKIPILVAGTTEEEIKGKRVDCFGGRWFTTA